jgi:2-dehydropantoate 2-reductase
MTPPRSTREELAVSNSKIAIVGVGAIGGAVAADLADLGRHHIQLCSRTGFGELTVRHTAGVSNVRAPVVTNPKDTKPSDWILLATKAHQSVDAQPWFAELCHHKSVVAVLQNGVDHEQRIAPLVPEGVRVLPIIVNLPAEKMAPGNIEQMNPGMLTVPDSETGLAFAELFTGARTPIKVSDDFTTQAWWKLLNNAALGGVCALSLRGNAVAEDPEVKKLILDLMREVALVARAVGAKLPEDAPERALKLVLGAAPHHWSSITVDRREGRQLEWRTRNAVVGQTGRQHGISTPLNDVVTTLLKATDGALGTADSN